METSVDVQLIYNEKEIKKAISYFILQVNGIRIYALLFYPILLLATVLSLIFNEYALLSIVFFICGGVLYQVYYARPIEKYWAFYRKRKGSAYRFCEDKIFAINDDVQCTYMWTVFKKAYETPSAFLLLDDNKFVYIFPKRCFSNMLDVERLRKLFLRNFLMK